MSISIMQAVILALWYWVTTWYIGYTWGSATFGDALVTGLVVGIVMGDVPTAMKCAAVIKPMFEWWRLRTHGQLSHFSGKR